MTAASSEEDDAAGICAEIRDKIICGKCASSTLLLSRKSKYSEWPKAATIHTVPDGYDDRGEEIEIDYYYLVRCSFFKFNVNRPDEIVFCESFKLKE